jgi:phenylalanyl-tRNA synthetase beta chain
VRDGLAGQGLLETVSLPFGPTEGEGSVRLLNPLSAEDAFLRQSLLPILVRAAETNWSHQTRDIRLFEIGTGFRASGTDLRPAETLRVAGILSGRRAPAHWTDPSGGDFELWDLAALFQAAVALAYPAAQVQVDTHGWVARTPDGRTVGHARRLTVTPPAWAAPIFGFELDLARDAAPPVRYRPLATTPAAWRDVNLVLGPGVTATAVESAVSVAGGALLESVTVQSEFRSGQLGADHRAVQFRLTFRSPDKTVRDEEVDAAMKRILTTLERTLDAKLRTA